MMFTSSPLDKNCINSDSCSPGRNNAPNRFSVGITPLGDENQQIRIQLAVHKYNGTSGSPFNNRCSFMSPVRHSFLKNSLKVRNYDGEHESTSKTDKRNGNQYEGVGAFPTIHLKKNAVRYRPIKRFHDVKIPYPELPVNRFLSHLPEVCPDLKQSTRSVLDVLEDLSGNKIHSKEDAGSSKPKPQGLGGDYLFNPNAVYKPLFVPKPKLNTVLTRDSTTQTLSPVSIETSSPQSSSSCIRNGASDPRAELRRKLAKQNNEIFASLSSSISSAFSLKRKIDKVLPSKDDRHLGDASALKKTKMLDYRSSESNENEIAKSVVTPKINSSESVKLNRKSKLNDTNSVSPNKDRLTTIFLDTRNTSPKARVFQANASTENKSAENGSEKTSNGHAETPAGPEDKIASSPSNGFAPEKSKDESGQGQINFSSSGKSAYCGSDKQDQTRFGQSDKTVVSFLTGKTDTAPKDTVKSTSSTLQLGANAADASSFSSPKALIGNVSDPSETCKGPANGSHSEQKRNDNKDTNAGFTFGKSNDKPNFGSFKFGTDGSPCSTQNKSLTDIKGSAPEPASHGDPIATSPTPQFSFGATSVATVPAPQTSTLHSGGTCSQGSTFPAPGKTTFTFGHGASPAHQNLESANANGKHETSSAKPPTTTPTIQPAAVSYGQRPKDDSAATSARQGVLDPATQASPSNAVGFATASMNRNSPNAIQPSGSLFAFGQKSETAVAATVPAAAAQEQTKTFTFAFGQNRTQEEAGQKSGHIFSSEQKPSSQGSSQNSAVSTEATAPSQQATARVSQTLTQTASAAAATATPHVTFTQNSASQTSTAFGAKFEGSSLGGIPTSGFNPTNPVFPSKTLSFGSSIGGFGKTTTTTQATTGFATSTSTAPPFGFGVPTTTQSIPTFGISPAAQSAPTFGPSSTAQSSSAFGNTSAVQTAPAFGTSTSHPTPGFVVSPTTQTPSSFGVSSGPQSTPTFGSSSSKQSTPSFGTTTTQSTPAFPGVSSQPAPTFGTSSATQTSTFPAPTAFGLPSSQPAAAFGSQTSTQSPMRFGPATTQTNTSFLPSTGFSTAPSTQPSAPFGTPAATSAPAFAPTQSLDNKPVASVVQTPNIFGQNPAPGFSSTATFTSNQTNIFAQKPPPETPVFGHNKIQAPGFGSTSPAFGSQNKFSFGLSTSNATSFTTSPPSTTAAPVFSFGGGTSGNAFAFGSNSSGSSNAQTPFAFKSPANEPFKFGASTSTAAATTTTTTAKEGTGFGGAGSTTFSFSGQMNNNPVAEQKPTFNFTGTQAASSASGFNFGATPSPSVFNFGGSTSSGSSGSSFNFGTPTPPGVPFGQTASPGAPFAVPGTFNIGSGSSQSRPRASSRPRRRP